MRTKSEARRQAIVSAASAAFQQLGFGAASMDEVARRTPCSKGTLYAYFSSKEDLFYEAIVEPVDLKFQAMYLLLKDQEQPVREVLLRFGEAFIEVISTAEVRTMRRLMMAASSSDVSEIAQRCFDAGPARGLAECMAFLQSAHERGQLRVADARISGLQLRALLEAEWLDPMLYGSAKRPAKELINASAGRAVDAFLAIHHRGN